jgi:hypothetical protein
MYGANPLFTSFWRGRLRFSSIFSASVKRKTCSQSARPLHWRADFINSTKERKIKLLICFLYPFWYFNSYTCTTPYSMISGYRMSKHYGNRIWFWIRRFFMSVHPQHIFDSVKTKNLRNCIHFVIFHALIHLILYLILQVCSSLMFIALVFVYFNAFIK